MKRSSVIPTHVPWGADWEFVKDGEAPVVVHMKGALKVNSVAAMVPAAVAGLGLALMPEYFLWEKLNDGVLVELLPEWATPPGPVFLVTPPGRARPARVRVLLDFLRSHFARQPWAQGIER